MEDLRLTLIQTELAWEDPKANRDHFSEKLKALAGTTDLILLPEMFTTGFSMDSAKMAEEKEGPTLRWLQEQAQKTKAALSGSVIVKEGKHYYNRLYFVTPSGNYKQYDKRHLFSYAGEDGSYTAGEKKLIVEYKGWRICPLICFDLRFPVWSRNTEDYDLLFYIANWPQERIQSWDFLLQARSIENLCYTAGLNRIGQDPKAGAYNGHSAVYDALGNKISATNWEEEFTQTIWLKGEHLASTRKKFRFLPERDQFKIQ